MYKIVTCWLIIAAFCGCSVLSPWRTVYAVVDSADRHVEIDIDGAVKMGAKEVGYVKRIGELDSGRVLLELAIHKTIRIERPARVRVEEQILGGSTVEIVSLADVAVAGEVKESDTLSGHIVPLKRLQLADSAEVERVVKGLKMIKGMLDTIASRDSAMNHR